MKILNKSFLICALIVSYSGHARNIDVKTAEIAEGSPEAYAITFAEVSNAGDIEKAKSMVSEEYMKLMTSQGSLPDEALIKDFKAADFEKLFQYRVTWPDKEKYPDECIVSIRYYSTEKDRKTRKRLSLKKMDDKWKIVRESECDYQRDKQ